MPSMSKHQSEEDMEIHAPPPCYNDPSGDLASSGCDGDVLTATSATATELFQPEQAMADLKASSEELSQVAPTMAPGLLQMFVAGVASFATAASSPVFKTATNGQIQAHEDEADVEYDEINGVFHAGLAAESASLSRYERGTPTREMLAELETMVTDQWPTDFCTPHRDQLLQSLDAAKAVHAEGLVYAGDAHELDPTVDNGSVLAVREYFTDQFATLLAAVNHVFNSDPVDEENPAPENLAEADKFQKAAEVHEAQSRAKDMNNARKNQRECLKNGLEETNKVQTIVKEMLGLVAKTTDAVNAHDGTLAAKTATCLTGLEAVAATLQRQAQALRARKRDAVRRCNAAADAHQQTARTAGAAATAAMTTAEAHSSGRHGKAAISFAELGMVIGRSMETAAEQQKLCDAEEAKSSQLWARMGDTEAVADGILAKYGRAMQLVELQRALVTSSSSTVASMTTTVTAALLELCRSWTVRLDTFRIALLRGQCELTTNLLAYYTIFEELPAENAVEYRTLQLKEASKALKLEQQFSTPDDQAGVDAAEEQVRAKQKVLDDAVGKKEATSAVIASLLAEQRRDEVLAELGAVGAIADGAVEKATQAKAKLDGAKRSKARAVLAMIRNTMFRSSVPAIENGGSSA